MQTRVLAPSPTGLQRIGGVRQLVQYFFARSQEEVPLRIRYRPRTLSEEALEDLYETSLGLA